MIYALHESRADMTATIPTEIPIVSTGVQPWAIELPSTYSVEIR